MKKYLSLSPALAALCLATACEPAARGGVAFHLQNAGAQPMRQVVVHVRGRSYAVGDIAAGASASVTLHPRGESHIELAQPGRPRLVVDCYMDSGYTGSIHASATTERIVAVDAKVLFAAY